MAIRNIPQPGHTLKNGALVLLFTELPEKEGNHDGGIVLAYNRESKEFAVWLYVEPKPESHRPPYCTQGDYSNDIEVALNQYLRRVMQAKGLLRTLR